MNGSVGLYIHIPFCIRRCPYCDFYSQTDLSLTDAYTDALVRNAGFLKSEAITADTIYFGGGTPSLLSGKQVYRILDSIEKNVRLISPEITLETNPTASERQKLRDFRSAGVNRLSIGVQSFSDCELSSLGRLHSADQAENAVYQAQEAGFENISCDLMAGVPEQTPETLTASAKRLVSSGTPHISAYMLKIESGTPFDTEEIRKASADDELMSEMYLSLCDFLSGYGYEHYEISNFSKPGYCSKHNMKYWRLEPYIGLGASAHSDYRNVRSECPGDINAFISAERQPVRIIEKDPDRAQEYLMLSLRLSEGLNKNILDGLCGENCVFTAESVFKRAEKLCRSGLAKIENDVLRLTDKGFLLSNSIILYLQNQ